MTTPRELVYKTLELSNTERAPRQLWKLPWAVDHYPDDVRRILNDFPDDIIETPVLYANPPRTTGDPAKIGEYVDEWGCRFVNKQEGIMGEVKEPLIKDEDWEDREILKLPEERLTFDRKAVNAFCKSTDQFVLAYG